MMGRDYIKRIEKYRERVWTCKITGKTGLSFEEALVSESRASKATNFPEEFLESLVRRVHQSNSKIGLFL